jgi:cytochrome c556
MPPLPANRSQAEGRPVKTLQILIVAVTAGALPALAAEDPIVARQTLMKSNGAAAAVAGGIMKDQIAYNPAVAKSVLAAWAAVGATYGDYFPEGSVDAARSKAAPKIWEDMAGFQAEVEKFATRASAGAEAAGKDGPADKAAFAAAAGPVLESCKSCHEAFRISDN